MATHGNRRATSFTRVASGVASLEPDPRRDRGWTLLVDGVPQSYVDLADPTFLAQPGLLKNVSVTVFS